MTMDNIQAKTSQLETLATPTKQSSLRQTVTEMIKKYYEQLDPATTTGVYDMVLTEVESPLLQETMQFTRTNQSRAAIVLGLSRGTLRKLLKKYVLNGQAKTDDSTDTSNSISLRQTVTETVKKYFQQVDVNSVTNVYEMVLAEIEEPLLQETMKFTRGNQSRAAIVCGLSRGTLRKLLKKYDLD